MTSFGLSSVSDVKLNGQNYREWETSIRVLLMGPELDHHLDDDPPEETDDAKKALRKKWNTNDRKVMSVICQNVEVPIRMDIARLLTTKEMWSHLQRRYI